MPSGSSENMVHSSETDRALSAMSLPKLGEKPGEKPGARPGVRMALWLIRGYQLVLSPWIGRQCRFYPTCSHYAAEAIEMHGFPRGTWLTLKRIGKCHPFHPGGVDLVPDSAPTSHPPTPTRTEQDL